MISYGSGDAYDKAAPTGVEGGTGRTTCQGVRGQAQGLPLPVVEGGTGRVTCQGVRGQAQGLPLPVVRGGRGGWRVWVCEGRHEACPYRWGGGDGEDDVSGCTRAGTRPAPTGGEGGTGRVTCQGVRGQAQGLPLPGVEGRDGEGGVSGCTRAGTRPAPTGGWRGGRGGRRVRVYEGRHKACPYRWLRGGRGGWRVRVYEGRHKACPYRWGGGDGEDEVSGCTRAGTRPAPTGGWRGGRGGWRVRVYEGRHKACPYRWLGGGRGG